MASKTPHLENDDDLTETSIDGTKLTEQNFPNENNSSPSQQSTGQVENETPPEPGVKSRAASSNITTYQSKLLIMYSLRALNFGYQFYLGTKLSVGDKFDDLIFHHKDENDVTYRQQYLKARHKLNENDPSNQIKANDLLGVKNGHFNLLTYFESFVKIRSQGNNIEYCIICTNVDFDYIDIESKRIILEHVDEENWPKLLNCKGIKRQQRCYKIILPRNFGNFKMSLSVYMLDCVINCTGKEMKSLFHNCTEVVNGKQFNDHTADEMKNFFSDPQNNNQIEKLVETVFDDYLDKLIFVVKTPNEYELDSILTNEVWKYFQLSKNREVGPNFVKLRTSYIKSEMEKWFKSQDKIWLTAEEASRIIHIDDDEPTVSMNENQKQREVKFTTCLSGKIDLDGKVLIGEGGYGKIYKCTFVSDDNKETQVAVKRIQHEDVKTNPKEEEVMSSLKGHINVVKLITTAEDSAFRYYVLELCRASLYQLYLEDGNVNKYSGPIPQTEDMLLQLAQGLKYIHANDVIHRDITPGNVLIWVGPKQNDEIQVVMKWADFGLSKPTTERGTYTQSSVVKGTVNWVAPELTNSSNQPRGTNKSDIYSEGLVFLYILLGDKYLYSSDSQVTKEPFKFQGPDYVQDIPSEYDWAKPLIQDGMLKTEPEDRLTAGEVVEQLLRNIHLDNFQ